MTTAVRKTVILDDPWSRGSGTLRLHRGEERANRAKLEKRSHQRFCYCAISRHKTTIKVNNFPARVRASSSRAPLRACEFCTARDTFHSGWKVVKWQDYSCCHVCLRATWAGVNGLRGDCWVLCTALCAYNAAHETGVSGKVWSKQVLEKIACFRVIVALML